MEGKWHYPHVWRRPEGVSPEHAPDAEHGDDDALVVYLEWLEYIHEPMCEHVSAIEWPDDLESFLTDIIIACGDVNWGVAAQFDLPEWARKTEWPMMRVLAARETLRRLRVIWYSPWDNHPTRGNIGINFRWHVWHTDPEEIARVFAEESARYAKPRTRPQEAQRVLIRTAIPDTLRWRVYARDGYACRYCGAKGIPLALDHVTPFTHGGDATEDNLVTCCRSCNSSKGARTPEEWQ